MIRRPPRSTLDRSSAASDVYKRQLLDHVLEALSILGPVYGIGGSADDGYALGFQRARQLEWRLATELHDHTSVSYTHLRAHETVLDLVCRLLLEKKKEHKHSTNNRITIA